MWRGREGTPKRPKVERRKRLPSLRRCVSLLAILITLAVGAAAAVLVVYSLLPDDAQTWVLRVQEKVAELTPWLRSR
jgi:hypothetical protein